MAKAAWAMGCYLLICVCALHDIQAQPTADSLKNEYRLLHQIEAKAKNFAVDKLQNVYLLTAKNEVIKYGPDGTEQFRYPNRTLGALAELDATDPFNLLLFFPDYQFVMTLDRTLNPTGELNFQQLGFYRVGAVGMAGDGRIWVFDEAAFVLKKTDVNGAVAAESGNLGLLFGKALHPNFILEREQLVYVNDPAAGIFVFDVFGKYLKIIDIKGLSHFQTRNNELLFFAEGKLWSFHLQALLQKELRLPEGIAPTDKVLVEKDRLYHLQEGKLKVFEF